MKRTLIKTPDITGHVLVRSAVNYTHSIEFTTLDQSYMRLRSWNAPSMISYPAASWVLLSSHKMKKAAARILWRTLAQRGYWIWLGGKTNVKPVSAI